MRRLSIGLMVCVGGLAVTGCPTSVRTDTGGGGIDANLVPMDAPAPICATMTPETTAEACTDGCDNDANGFVDCNDFACCSVTECGPTTGCGRRSDAGPRPDAPVVACPSTGPETTAAACTDGCDNDGNGFVDCGDFDCCGAVSCAPDTACGRRGDSGPRADAFLMACPTTGPENTVAACMDGCNNDGDFFADCDDFDCCSLVACGPDTGCGRRAMTDTGPRRDAAVMACATAGPEDTAAACGDGCDNDGNGFFDCGDFDCCRVISGCGPTTACGRDAGPSTPRDAGPRCDAGAGAAQEMGMAGCTDGIDNDCDGFTDCRDFGCTRDAPAGRTYCLTTPENTAAACTDMMDNDLDSFIDCNDSNCCGIVTPASCSPTSFVGAGRCT